MLRAVRPWRDSYPDNQVTATPEDGPCPHPRFSRSSARQLDVVFLVPALDLEVESRRRGVVEFVRDLDVASRTGPAGLGLFGRRWVGGRAAQLLLHFAREVQLPRRQAD